VLIEYEGSEDGWQCFASDQQLMDYIQRVPGVPISIPEKSFSPLESARIVRYANTTYHYLFFVNNIHIIISISVI
jgi:enhancing lycopene biosynthesis protein 2